MAQAAQVRQCRALGFLGVTQQAAGCADRQGQVFAAEALEVLSGELLAQALVRRVSLEVPRRAATWAPRRFSAGKPCGQSSGNQQLHRIDALKLGQQVFPALDFQHREVAAGDVQNGQP
jgi:hypothetical protein